MLRIRLQRKGKKNQPFFRIVVTEKKNPPKGGRAVETLGFLNPLTKEKNLKADRIKYWLSVGAQPSDRVHNLLVSEGIIKDKKKPVHAKPKKKEGEEEKSAPVSAEAKPAEKAEAKKEEVKPEVKPEEVKEVKEPKEEKPKEEPKPEKPAEKPEDKKEEKKEDKPKEKPEDKKE